MKITNEREVVKEAIAFYIQRAWQPKTCLDSLIALDPEKATMKEIEDIVGISGVWQYSCDECDARGFTMAKLGPDLDYEIRPVTFCLSCLKKAVVKLEAIETIDAVADIGEILKK